MWVTIETVLGNGRCYILDMDPMVYTNTTRIGQATFLNLRTRSAK